MEIIIILHPHISRCTIIATLCLLQCINIL